MKYFYLFTTALLFTALLTSCAGNKKLQNQAPAQMGQAYTSTNANSIQLYIPVSSIQTNKISLDSVYFRGMAAPIELDPATPGVYIANFDTGKPDLIMSSDPKEEYQNKMPRTAAKAPVKLENDEAILVFSKNNKIKYYKLKGIKER